MDPYNYSYQYGVENSANPIASFIFLLFYLFLIVIYIVAVWKMFEKAGVEGWKSLIPFYNTYIQLLMIGKPGWWLVLFFVPIANIVVAVIMSIKLANVFGKSTTWGIFLNLIFPIGPLILGFGSAQYTGPLKKTGSNIQQPSTPNVNTDQKTQQISS